MSQVLLGGRRGGEGVGRADGPTTASVVVEVDQPGQDETVGKHLDHRRPSLGTVAARDVDRRSDVLQTTADDDQEPVVDRP